MLGQERTGVGRARIGKTISSWAQGLTWRGRNALELKSNGYLYSMVKVVNLLNGIL